jgi:hypothetical protein
MPSKVVRPALVIFDCRHSRNFPQSGAPKVGEEIYCFRCGTVREVIDAPSPYRLRCRYSKCKLSRTYGVDKTTCYRAANKHLMGNPTHIIVISRGIKEIERLTLAGDPYAPEDKHGLREAAKKNQSTLRSLLDTVSVTE